MSEAGEYLRPAWEEDEYGAGDLDPGDVLQQRTQQLERHLPLIHPGHGLNQMGR